MWLIQFKFIIECAITIEMIPYKFCMSLLLFYDNRIIYVKCIKIYYKNVTEIYLLFDEYNEIKESVIWYS